jgi:hypothetical protein
MQTKGRAEPRRRLSYDTKKNVQFQFIVNLRHMFGASHTFSQKAIMFFRLVNRFSSGWLYPKPWLHFPVHVGAPLSDTR